jgi:sugar phosphate permease
MIRYTLVFWLPLYLANQLKMTPIRAGYVSSGLEGYGVAGVLGAAYASDHLFRARRFPVAALMMLSLSATCIVTSYLSVVASAWQIAVILALLGCATYGTDTLMAGAATQDSANTEDIGTIAGAVDGAGSTGQILSPIFVAVISQHWGWPAVFRYLALTALLCSVLLALGVKTERSAAATNRCLTTKTTS